MNNPKGHVFSIDFEEKYNNWGSCEPVELFDAPTLKSESNPKSHIARHLANEAKNADYLILWLDCDREGENICFEVIQCAAMHLNKRNSKSFQKNIKK